MSQDSPASSTGRDHPRVVGEADDLDGVLREAAWSPASAAPAPSTSPRPRCRAAPSSRTGRPAARPSPTSAARSPPPRSPRRRAARPARSRRRARRRAAEPGRRRDRRAAGEGRRGTGTQDGVADRADDVERLLVAEPPLPRRPGRLPGGARVPDVVAAAPARLQHREDPAQRGRSQPAYGPRGQLQRPAGAVEVALPLQLALDPAQRLEVVDRLPAERPLHQLGVDVVQRRARVVLVEHRVQLVQVGDLGQRPGRVAEAERRGRRPSAPGRPSAGPAAPPAAAAAAGPARRRARRRRARRPSGRPAPAAARRTGCRAAAAGRRRGGPARPPARPGSPGAPGRSRRTAA